MRVVGFDLSLTGSGVALTAPAQPPHQFVLTLVGRQGVTNMSVVGQFAAIDELLAEIATAADLNHPPDVAVLEALDMAQSYGGQIERTVLWWELAKTLHMLGVRVYVPTSAQVKIYATGNGLAKKPQVKAAVATHWPWWDFRNNDNLADAAVMAELGLTLAGYRSVELPKEHTRTLSKIRLLSDPPSRVTNPRPKKAKR